MHKLSCVARLWLAVFLSMMTGMAAFAFVPIKQTGSASAVSQVKTASVPVSMSALHARKSAAAKRPDLKVSWNNSRGIPSMVSGDDLLQEASPASKSQGKGVASDTDMGQKAVRVMGALSGVYGIQDASKEFSLHSVETSMSGYRHARLKQTYQGLPVFGGEVIVHFDKQEKARRVNGQYCPIGNLNITPTLTADQVKTIAASDQTFMGKPTGTVTGPSLLIYARDTAPTLAYQLMISYSAGNDDGRWRYWIDAKTGAVLLRYNDIQSAAPGAGSPAVITGNLLTEEGGALVSIDGFKENAGNYFLYSRVNTWYLFNWPTQDYVSETTADWGAMDRTWISGAFNCQEVEKYYRNYLGRNSVDNAGLMLRCNIHRTGMVNAYWDPQQLSMNVFDELPCALDVIGHECTHGVTQFTAQLVYANESGALNESMSDIFGTLVEFYAQPDGRASYPGSVPGHADWLMGEDTGPAIGVIRDMRAPRRLGQPSKYKGTNWDPGQEVHQNDGVQNFFFYLFADENAKTGNNDGINYSVTGIGTPAAGKVAYLTLTAYMGPNTDYTAARDAWVAAAEELDAAGTTTNAALAAMLAWAACGIGSADFILPSSGYVAGGPPVTGPYIPTNKVYSVMYPTTNAVWTVFGTGQTWLTIDTSSMAAGSPGGSKVTLAIDQAVAQTLDSGVYMDTVTFTNTTGIGNTTRRVVLRIGNNYGLQSVDYNWIDPMAGLHTVVSAPTGVSSPYALPFPVSFYDVAYTSLYVSARGMVGFLPDSLDAKKNSDFPDSEPPNGMLCPLWDAIDGRRLPARMYYKVVGVPPDRKIVVSWIEAPHDDDLTAKFSFQVIIPEHTDLVQNNNIIFQYKNVAEDNAALGSGQSATVAIEDEYGALFKKYSYNGEQWLANETALMFTQSPITDTNAPLGRIQALGGVGSSAQFEVKFNESVNGLAADDLIMTSTVPGATLGAITGGGMRYLVSVDNITTLGRITMSVVSNAVADWAGNSNAAFGPAIYVVPLLSTNFSDNMEGSPVNWTPSTNVYDAMTMVAWQWGKPAYAAGPATAASGSNCWGTILTGDYPDGMNAWVESVPIEVGSRPILEFKEWHAFDAGLEVAADFGYVEVDGGSGWVNVTPGGKFDGAPETWTPQQIVLDNSQFGNRIIKVRFRAVSDFTNTMAGLYFDDVLVQSQRAPGVWVVNYSPTNAAAPATVPVAFTVYNSFTSSWAQVAGDVSSPYAGANVVTSSVPVVYGAMGPGDIATGVAPVQLALSAPGNFTTPNIRLIHQSRSLATAISADSLPFTVDGVVASPATNILTVTSGTGVTNWLGQYLKGSGGVTSCLFQVIAAGSNAVPDSPTLTGQVSGDDRVLYAAGTGLPWGRFGEGTAIPPDFGRFLKSFTHGEAAGTKIYVRAWDASSFEGSVAYGDSPLYTLSSGTNQSHDFGTWIVAVPLNSGRDANGDGILDAYCVTNHMDPRLPIGPLAASWSLSQAALGSVGTGPQQFGGPTPSPTRLFYKGALLYVLDTGNNRIQIWNRLTRAYIGAYGAQGTNNGAFKRPVGLALDPMTNRFAVADQGNNRIQVFSFDPVTGTNIVFLFAFGDADMLAKPTDVAIDSFGWFYVTDERTGTVDGPMGFPISVDQSVLEVFDADGFDFGPLANAGAGPGQVNKPGGVCVGPNDTVIVADTGNSRVQAFDAYWNLLWPLNGTNSISFAKPRGVQVGLSGRVYVADTDNSQIKLLRADGSYISTLGSQGYGFNLVLNHPYGLMPVVESNIVYVADTLNNRVLTIAPIFDGDGDGMDDIWEELHGLNPNDPNDAMLSSFGLGIPNIGAYRLGLNPTPALPPPASLPVRITAFSVTPPNLKWDIATNGGIYQVDYSTDSWLIASNSWVPGPIYTSAVNGTMDVNTGLSLTNRIQYIRVRRLSSP